MTLVNLTTRNVWTTVESSDEVYKFLDVKLKVWMKGAERTWLFKSRKWDGCEHHFTDAHKFRTGLLMFVVELLEGQGHTIHVDELCDRPPTTLRPINLKGIKLRPYQEDAVDLAIRLGRGVIQHGTGGGKTETDAAIVQRLGLPTIMLVDQRHIASQTRDRWEARLGVKVGLLGAGVRQTKYDIVCATFQSVNASLDAPARLMKAIEKAKPDKRGPLLKRLPAAKKRRDNMLDWLSGFDVLVVDEGHHLVAPTYQSAVDKIPAFYRYVTSATPFKSKGGKDRDTNDDPSALFHVVGTTGPLIHEFNAGDLVDEGYTVHANIVMTNWRKPHIKPSWSMERGDFDIDDDHYDYTGRKATKTTAAEAGLYRVAIMEHKERNNAVCDDVEELRARGLPVLVFVDKVEHGRELYTALCTRQDSSQGIKFIHGKHDVEERDVHLTALGEGRLPVLIASTVLDEGVDIPANISLVFAAGGKAQHRYIQRIGRGQRLADGKYVVEVRDYFDTHSKTMWMHSNKRLSAYQSDPAGYTVEVR
jgi:superfamily II DNA or RNA helicase